MKISIVNKTSFELSFEKIKEVIINTLKKNEASDDSEISVVIVGDDEMYKYAKNI